MQRKASDVWQGNLKAGKGSISTDSGVLSNTQYSFSTRFEDGVGTNPEELIAAAHAGCFSMALSGQLGGANMVAESIDTTATLTMEKRDVPFHGCLIPRSPWMPSCSKSSGCAGAGNSNCRSGKSNCPFGKLPQSL